MPELVFPRLKPKPPRESAVTQLRRAPRLGAAP